MRTYAEIEDLIQQMLQDTTPSIYDTTETAYWIEESLKEFSTYFPHIVGVMFQIESRTGTDTAGTTDLLTDTTKDQFIATADATDEKVVHNTTDSTWAVVTASTATVLTLNADIMGSGDSYEIYNKRCTNQMQIYIGDMPLYLWVDSVEYPLGTKRNWKVYDEVLEINVASVADSDSTLDPPNNIDVLVRFAMPHILSQLTDWDGELNADETEGDTAISIDGMGSTEIIEVGEEFHLENHRTLYFVTKEDTTSGNAVAALEIYPPLEADAPENDDITFVKSTLKPQHEEIFCHLVAARAVLSDYIRHIGKVLPGGPRTIDDYRQWARDKLAEVLGKLERLSPPRTSRIYPKD